MEKWKHARRVPTRLEGGRPLPPTIALLLSATENNHELEFLYPAGSNPGRLRRVAPGLVFKSDGFPGCYLSGYCPTRRAERVFRVEAIELS